MGGGCEYGMPLLELGVFQAVESSKDAICSPNLQISYMSTDMIICHSRYLA